MSYENLKTVFENSLSYWKNLPKWILESKTNSINSFQELLENSSKEYWKYTSKEIYPENSEISIPKEELKYSKDKNFILIHLQDGQVTELSNIEELKGLNIQIQPLSKAFDTHSNEIKSILINEQNIPNHPYNELNKALFHDGVLVSIPSKCDLKKPIIIKSEFSKSTVSAVKNIFLIGEEAGASIFEELFFNDKQVYLNSAPSFKVSKNAKVKYGSYLSGNSKSKYISSLTADIKEFGKLDIFTLSNGASVARCSYHINLAEKGAETGLYGAYTTFNKDHLDNQVYVNHAAPHTISKQVFKGLISDSSKAVFSGKVRIEKGCFGSHAEQINKNILLSPKAFVETEPQLEIYNEDVKANHGSTVGQLEPEHLFYLESRGIPKDLAKKMITHGFLIQTINEINFSNENLHNRVNSLLDKNLERL